MERLTKGRRSRTGGRPELEELAFGGAVVGGSSPSVDDVWSREWSAFRAAILTRESSSRGVGRSVPTVSASACDARQALRVVQTLYEMPAQALTELSD